MIVAAIMKVTTKLNICLHVNRMVLTARMAEYKLGVAHSALNTITDYEYYWAGC